jgi:hypothetical protein
LNNAAENPERVAKRIAHIRSHLDGGFKLDQKWYQMEEDRQGPGAKMLRLMKPLLSKVANLANTTSWLTDPTGNAQLKPGFLRKRLMRELIYDNDGVAVLEDGSKYYVRYDAGAHQVAIREDETSEDEAKQVMSGTAEATRVLFAPA